MPGENRIAAPQTVGASETEQGLVRWEESFAFHFLDAVFAVYLWRLSGNLTEGKMRSYGAYYPGSVSKPRDHLPGRLRISPCLLSAQKFSLLFLHIRTNRSGTACVSRSALPLYLPCLPSDWEHQRLSLAGRSYVVAFWKPLPL